MTLNELRKEKGYTQRALAERVGVAKETVAAWENGRAAPFMKNVSQLSAVFGISVPEVYEALPKARENTHLREMSYSERVVSHVELTNEAPGWDDIPALEKRLLCKAVLRVFFNSKEKSLLSNRQKNKPGGPD